MDQQIITDDDFFNIFNSLPEMDFIYPSPTSPEETTTNSLDSKFQPQPNYYPIKDASDYITSSPSPESQDTHNKEESGNKALEEAFSGVDLELAQSLPDNSPNPQHSNPLYTDIYPNSNSGFLWGYTQGGVSALPGYVNDVAVNGDQISELSSKRMRPLNYNNELQSKPL